MSTDGRLRRLEDSLTPKQATLLWLPEAHAHGSAAAYAAALPERPDDEHPLALTVGRAEGGARRATIGEPADLRETARREAIAGALFLYRLVLLLDERARERCRIDRLRWAFISQWRRAGEAEAELARRDRHHEEAERIEAGRPRRDRAAIDLLLDIYREREARRLLEERYLDGHPVLFPETTAAVDEVTESVEGLASVAMFRLCEAERGKRRRGKAGKALDREAALTVAKDEAPHLADRLADQARFLALDFIDSPRARPYLEPYVRAFAAAGVDDHGAPDPGVAARHD